MGLKQDVANAMQDKKPVSEVQIPTTPEKTAQPTPTPVTVSPEAIRALSTKVREWSGWPKARLIIGDPGPISPWASVDHPTATFTVNADSLILNPHRVLLTVTPFRLRQEAVLTGTLLHEAGHARHTHWKPRTEEQVKGFRHSDGSHCTQATFALASLMEEPRIEGMQARDADKIGAAGLGWTMRASAAHLIPTTVLNVTVPEQKIMDLITSWALRAGRQLALNHYVPGYQTPNWVGDFTSLLHTVLISHFVSLDSEDINPNHKVKTVVDLLLAMIKCTDDDGSTMIDLARSVLNILFPETDEDDMPQPNGGCESGAGGGSGDPEEGSEGDESAEQAPGGAEGQTPPEEAGDEAGEGEEDTPEGAGDSEDEAGSGDSEPDNKPDPADDDGTGFGELGDQTLEEYLAELEATAQSDAKEEADEESKQAPTEGGSGAGTGGGGRIGGGFRNPTKDERDIAKRAEKFLRDLIAPTESSAVHLSESPSATVDPAALAAWKADGGTRDPRFFIRTRREVEPSPPVQVAILVDISGSMGVLQKPSAILSWSLASAALDLRNFAGRGRQMESTLIHWGDEAQVIQKNGQILPGIREVPCMQGTSGMHRALALVEEEMPGFFDITEKPVHRLLVQFTDWCLTGWSTDEAGDWINRAMTAGVNMVSVVPKDYAPRYANLSQIMAACKVQRGTSSVLKYDPKKPSQVWDEAAKALV